MHGGSTQSHAEGTPMRANTGNAFCAQRIVQAVDPKSRHATATFALVQVQYYPLSFKLTFGALALSSSLPVGEGRHDAFAVAAMLVLYLVSRLVSQSASTAAADT